MSKLTQYARHLAVVAIATLLAQCAWAAVPVATWTDFSSVDGTAKNIDCAEGSGYQLSIASACSKADDGALVIGGSGSDGGGTAGASISLSGKNLKAATLQLDVSGCPDGAVLARYLFGGNAMCLQATDGSLYQRWTNNMSTDWNHAEWTATDRQTITIAYDGTGSSVVGTQTYRNGNSFIARNDGLKASNTNIDSFGIGFQYANHAVATGMKVYAIRVFDSRLTDAEVSAAYMDAGHPFLVNLKTNSSANVDGWNNYTHEGGCNFGPIPNAESTPKFNVTSNNGNFKGSFATASSDSFAEGTYVDIYGVSHMTLPAEIAASLGLSEAIPESVYKTGMAQGARWTSTDTISGLMAGKKYVVYAGIGIKRDATFKSGFKVETSGYGTVDALEYVVTQDGDNTTAATKYTSFEAGTAVVPGQGGMIVIRMVGVTPNASGNIVFKSDVVGTGVDADGKAALSFVAVASMPVTTNKYIGTDGAWDTAVNWSNGQAPTSADEVVIDTDCTLTITDVSRVGNVVVKGNVAFTGAGINTLLGDAGTLTIAVGATATITGGELKQTQVVNNGTLKFQGGTEENPIKIFDNGAANTGFGTVKLAANTVVLNDEDNNHLHTVTGEGPTSVYKLTRTGSSFGHSPNTTFRNLTYVNAAENNQSCWVERANSFDSTVNVRLDSGSFYLYGYNPTIGSLSGSAALTRSGNATITVTCGSDAEYTGSSSVPMTIAGTAVQTLSGAYTGALTVNNNASVKLAGSANPSSISGVGTIIKDDEGTLALTGNFANFTGLISFTAGTLQLPAGAEGTMTVPEGATLKLKVTSVQRAEGYSATGITFATEGQKIVFIDSDGTEITEDVTATALLPKTIDVVEGQTMTLDADNLPTAAVRVQTGGILDVKGVIDTEFTIILDGGTLVNTGDAISEGTKQTPNIVLTKDSTIEASSNFGSIAGGYGAHEIKLNGHKLTKTGANYFWVKNATFVGGGEIDIQAGTMKFDNGTAFSDGNVTLNIAEGAKAEFVTAPTFTAITGSGTLESAVVPAQSALNSLANAEGWTGTFFLKGGNIKPNAIGGNASSKVKLSGVTISDVDGNGNCMSDVEIAGTVTFNNWYGNPNVYKFGKLSGSGNIATSGYAWYGITDTFMFTDAENFTGNISYSNVTKGGPCFVIGDAVPGVKPTGNDGKPHGFVYVQSGYTLGISGTYAALNTPNTIAGTLKVKTASAALTDGLTFVEGSTVDLSAADSLLTIPSVATGSTTVTVGDRTITIGDKLIAWEAKPEALTLALDSTDFVLEQKDDGAYVAAANVTITLPTVANTTVEVWNDSVDPSVKIPVVDGAITVAPNTEVTIIYTPVEGYAGGGEVSVTIESAETTISTDDIIVTQPVAKIECEVLGVASTYYVESLEDAFTPYGGAVTLLKDVTLTETLNIPATFVGALDLNGKSISYDAQGAYVISIPAGANIVIGSTDNTVAGCIVNSNDFGAAIANRGTLSLYSINIEGTVATIGGVTFVESQLVLEKSVMMYLDFEDVAKVPYVYVASNATAGLTVSNPVYQTIESVAYHAYRKMGNSISGETTYVVATLSPINRLMSVTKTAEHASIVNVNGLTTVDETQFAEATNPVTFSVIVDEGYEISSVTVNGVELTAEDGVYTATPAQADTAFAIVVTTVEKPKPTATCTELTAEQMPEDPVLDSAYVFTATNDVEDYYDWKADFEVSFDKDIAADSVMLYGQYDADFENGYKGTWVGFYLPAVTAGTKIGLVGEFDANLTYADVCTNVKKFYCGVINKAKENAGTVMTVKLVLSNDEETLVITETTYTLAEPKVTDLPGAEEVSAEEKAEYNEWAAANGVTESTTTDTKVLATAYAMGVIIGEFSSIEEAAKQAVEDEVPSIDMTELTKGDLTAAVKAINEKYNGKIEASLVEATLPEGTVTTAKLYKLVITIKSDK